MLLFFYGCSKQDQDKDGFGILEGDCDHKNPDVHPAGKEICDGIDNEEYYSENQEDCRGVAINTLLLLVI